MKKELIGEFAATFILLLFGSGSVALAVLGYLTELYQVALFWGAGVTIGIFATRNFCPSHMNPAVSLAMVIAREMPLKKLLPYALFQLLGAFAAAAVVYAISAKGIAAYELENGIVRGSFESNQTALIFGEFFPNPAYAETHQVSHLKAFVIEVIATMALLKGVFLLTGRVFQHTYLTPILIGLLVVVLIIFVAPYTQACLNPARDLGPRLVAMLAGWGRAAFPTPFVGLFTVYIVAPLLGASLGAFMSRKPKGFDL